VRETAVKSSTNRFYRKGVIFREGDEGNVMYVIRSGKVKITKNVYGIMVTLAELGPGDHFGEMSLLEEVPRSATAIAETDLEADVLDSKALSDYVATKPEFALKMLRAMSRRLRQIDERLTDLVAKGRLPKDEASAIGPPSVY
jgi:CRP/FNR family transcriptional regulator, cyclic AMP receptor protein